MARPPKSHVLDVAACNAYVRKASKEAEQHRSVDVEERLSAQVDMARETLRTVAEELRVPQLDQNSLLNLVRFTLLKISKLDRVPN